MALEWRETPETCLLFSVLTMSHWIFILKTSLKEHVLCYLSKRYVLYMIIQFLKKLHFILVLTFASYKKNEKLKIRFKRTHRHLCDILVRL